MKKKPAKKTKSTANESALLREIAALRKEVQSLARSADRETKVRKRETFAANVETKGAQVEIVRPRLERGDNPRNPMVHKSRAYFCDGTNVYLRRKKANPAIIERVRKQVEAGDLRHVRTDDGVEAYEIAEDSPLKRKHLSLSEMTPIQIEQEILRSACQRDWKLYYDAVSELAYQYKNGVDSAGHTLPAPTAHLLLQETMKYLQLRIGRRGGPSPEEIARELKKIRSQRTGTQIFLAPDSNIDLK